MTSYEIPRDDPSTAFGIGEAYFAYQMANSMGADPSRSISDRVTDAVNTALRIRMDDEINVGTYIDIDLATTALEQHITAQAEAAK